MILKTNINKTVNKSYKSCRHQSFKYIIFLVAPLLIFTLGISIGQMLKINMINKAFISTTVTENRLQLDKFWQVFNLINQTYLREKNIDNKKMVYGAITGMVNALGDHYTYFLNPKQYKRFQNDLGGTLSGIGAELTIKDAKVVVVNPLKNSPAKKAGLEAGDIILQVDDKVVANMNFIAVIMAIRGKEGTAVTLTVVKTPQVNKKTVIKKYQITRAKIKIPSVELKYQVQTGKKIAIININQFGDDTTHEFQKITDQLLLAKPRGIILDLRNNGGGYLEAAVDIASKFIPQGVIVSAEGKTPNSNFQRFALGQAQLKDLPVVVLVNENSASAAEILAGALSNDRQIKLVGTTTFGKGTVQDLIRFDDGSALRITIAHWLTPNGNQIDKNGIKPDFIVKLNRNTKSDEQLQKALTVLTKLIKL